MTTNLAPPICWQPIVTNLADTNTANPSQFYRAMLVLP